MNRPDVLVVENVSKKFIIHKDKSLKERLVNAARSNQFREEYWALKDINLRIKAGESLGLVGPNGSGKSTLLKVLGGILTPNQGTVKGRGRIAALLELGAGFHPDLTGRDNIYLNGAILGLSRAEIDSCFDDIVDFSGIADFIDTQVKFYSSGMYVRLAFAVAVHSNPDILLVDEVLAVGDEAFQKKCMDKIREFQQQGRSIILVSHSAQQIIDVCDSAVVLEEGKLVYSGSSQNAMRYLHGLYQEASARERAHVIDRNSAKIAQIRFENAKNTAETEQVLLSGEDLKIFVDLEAMQKPLADYALIVAMQTASGRHIVSIDTRNTELQLPALEIGKPVQLCFTIPKLNLGLGDYKIDAVLLDGEGYEIDSLLCGDPLQVRGESITTGVININPVVSFCASS